MSKAKKSFGNIMDDNPALQYITVRPKEDVRANDTQDTSITQDTQDTFNTQDTQDTSITQNAYSTLNAQDTPNTPNTSNTQTTHDRSKTKETKTKRIYPIIQPSLRVDFEKVAYMQHVSMNELLIRLIKEHVQEKQELIDRYDALVKGTHDQ